MNRRIKENPDLLIDIIDYYKTHSLLQTALYFNCSRNGLYALLKNNNILLHDTKKTNECRKNTCKEIYGADNPMQTAEVKERYKKTFLNTFGSACYFSSEEYKENFSDIKNKRENTMIERYGAKTSGESEIITEKAKKTNLKKYGNEWSIASKEIRDKIEQINIHIYNVNCTLQDPVVNKKARMTMQEKYGVDYTAQSKELRAKMRSTTKKRYGVEIGTQSSEIIEKIKQTNLDKYGYEYLFQSEEFKAKSKNTMFERYGQAHSPARKFIYENIYFDSFPELCFYLYHIKNNIPIKHEPIKLTYYYDNEKHYYYPDFEVNGQLYEIKGKQFLAEDRTWCDPFNKNNEELQRRAKAKYYCAFEHNVIILYNKDYQKYIDWAHAQNYKKDDFLYQKPV